MTSIVQRSAASDKQIRSNRCYSVYWHCTDYTNIQKITTLVFKSSTCIMRCLKVHKLTSNVPAMAGSLPENAHVYRVGQIVTPYVSFVPYQM